MKQVYQVKGTPLKISAYSVKSAPAKICNEGEIEIIFCLKGTVKVSYLYREVELKAGNFISISQDAYYMYGGEDNLCVSLYISLKEYEDKYDNLLYRSYTCVGAYSEIYTPVLGFPTPETDRLQGLLLTLLYYVINKKDSIAVHQVIDQIVDCIIEDFDVLYFLNGNRDIPEDVFEKMVKLYTHMYKNYDQKFTLSMVAEILGISPTYVNEFLKKVGTSMSLLKTYSKIYKSEKFLLETDKTILEISDECGFASTKYYYKAFELIFNCTPRQFRQKYRKEMIYDIEYKAVEELESLIEHHMIKHVTDVYCRE